MENLFLLSLMFTYSVIYQYQYRFMAMCFKLLYIFHLSNCSFWNHWELFQFTSVSLWHMHIIVRFFWWLTYFWTLRDTLDTSCIYPAPVLESAIWVRFADSFYWRKVFETKICMLSMLIANMMSFLLYLLIWQNK